MWLGQLAYDTWFKLQKGGNAIVRPLISWAVDLWKWAFDVALKWSVKVFDLMFMEPARFMDRTGEVLMHWPSNKLTDEEIVDTMKRQIAELEKEQEITKKEAVDAREAISIHKDKAIEEFKKRQAEILSQKPDRRILPFNKRAWYWMAA